MNRRYLLYPVVLLILAGCSLRPVQTVGQKTVRLPDGMHLLADAEVTIPPADARKIIISVNVSNFGTEVCNDINQGITVEWPPELQPLVTPAASSGMVQPFDMMDRGTFTWEFTAKMPLAPATLQGVKVHVACNDPKRPANTVIARYVATP